MPTIDIDTLGRLDDDNLVEIGDWVNQIIAEREAPLSHNPEDSETARTLLFSLASTKLDASNQVTLAIHHTGEWWDWRYDTFSMTRPMLQSMANNFKNKVLHAAAPIDRQSPIQIGHGWMDDPPALGWATKLEVKKDGKEYTLFGTFQMSDAGKTALENGQYAFVSPKYEQNYTDQQVINGARKEHGPTLIHVALTNSPVLAELPNITLSKSPMSYDIERNQIREVQMTQEASPPAPVTPEAIAPVVPASPAVAASVITQPVATPATPTPSAPVVLAQPVQQPVPVVPVVPDGMIVLSVSELAQLRLSIETTNRRLEDSNRRAHTLAVESIYQEAARRGVPPVVLNILKPILLDSHPEEERTIELSKVTGEGADSVNLFEAITRLLNEMPTIDFTQLTREPQGDKPNATKTLDEARKEGKAMWAQAGIVPEFLKKDEE